MMPRLLGANDPSTVTAFSPGASIAAPSAERQMCRTWQYVGDDRRMTHVSGAIVPVHYEPDCWIWRSTESMRFPESCLTSLFVPRRLPAPP